MAMKLSIALVAVLAAFANAKAVAPVASDNTLMARYILNQAEWTSIATISTRDDTKNYPVVNLVSATDGAKGSGNGVPYFYMSALSATSKNLEKDNRATLLMSLVQGNYCQEKGYEPMDHRCPKAVFTGRIKKIQKTDPDYETAKNAVFARHPFLSHVPPNHNFYFAKLEIETIDVLASFGGAQHPSLDEYYNADSSKVAEFGRNLNKAN